MTAAGAGVAAAAVTALIQLLKQIFPLINQRISGAAMAFFGTGVLYLWAAVALAPSGFDDQMALIMAWLTCAVAAVGTYSAIEHGLVVAGVQALRSPKVADGAMTQLRQTVEANPDLGITVERDIVIDERDPAPR